MELTEAQMHLPTRRLPVLFGLGIFVVVSLFPE